MAVTLHIDNADNRGRVDYTRYLLSAERSPVVLRDRMNLPALLDFTLVPADAQFVVPRRSAYVRLTGLADALPPGGPRVPGPLFTGYITNEPATEFLGVLNRQPIYGYRCQATSEEYLLNVKRIGLLPPFLNQTAGQILRLLVAHLQPGRFDTSNVAEGAFIPLFVADPEKSWSEIARELAERSGHYYRALDGKIYFQPIGDLPAGVAVDSRERHFRPEALEISPLDNPIRNDVTIFGAVEPQAYVREYFVGDGFTSRFPLSAPVFGAESARLLADDFTGLAPDTTRWEEKDTGNFITLYDGRLNITGGTGSLNETTLVARQALELGGEVELIHGEFEFVSPSTGLLGGLYASATLTQANCLAGFEVSASGGTTRLRAVISGAAQSLDLTVQPDHHYILVTRLSADQPYRTQQSFASLAGAFGGEAVAAKVSVRLEVRDIDLANPLSPAVTVLYEAALDSLLPFAIYAPINSADLHAVANFLQVTRPIQARLETQLPGEAPRTRTLGFGIAGQDATITSDPHSNQWALEFYEDTIPALGEKIVLSYRAAGQARARVRDAASIAAEAALAGDDGARAAVLSEVNPSPRTSREAELAAQAFLADRAAPRYEGRYTTWGDFVDYFPRCGRLLEIRDESRYPAFTALIRSVTSEIRELQSERILHTLEFGQPSRFEELLRQLAPPEDVLGTVDDAPLPAIESTEVGSLFLDDVAGHRLAGATPGQFIVDLGAPPPAGGSYQVRRTDQGWGSAAAAATTQNLLGSFSAPSFQLSRTSRNQAFFIRPVAVDRTTSRYSSVIAIHYPLVPEPPDSLAITFGLDEQERPVIAAEIVVTAGKISDVLALELRDADNTTVLARWTFGQLQLQGNDYRAQFLLDNSVALARSKTLYAYTQNALGEYSAARTATAEKPAPAKPSLAVGNSVGQILEVLLDRTEGNILETQIQVIGPGGSFSAPAQDVVVPGQPEKFSFVATQSGGWTFRARRRDALGWSPWSDEPQGQVPPEVLVFNVSFFQAHELAPSIGAAINGQNLLPNSEFFLPGIVGQEGTHAARYFALVNAAADGSEVDHSLATNEMQWKASVNFTQANPGVRSLLTNLGKMLNPGEAITLSAALRHAGTGGFDRPVRFALRSPGSPSYELTSEIPTGTITNNYQWFSVAFTLPSAQAVPADLSAEIRIVLPAGQSLTSALYSDKAILNRGQRPAAFSLAAWDVVPLDWNASAGAYDLPATLVASSPRSSDPGNAGRLAGTGTEDLDPDFPQRYFRLTA
jgi:hypothetical protein